ncbi:hypothetical protein FKC98_04975 [Salmonella enterica]|nr:hypothetical protein [Salmonella enterica]
MKNKSITRISFVIENDKTEVFSKMAIDNFALYIAKMKNKLGDDFDYYLKDKKYINEIMDNVIKTTKPDFVKWMGDNNIGGCSFFIDEVMEDLKYSYREFKKIYRKHGI